MRFHKRSFLNRVVRNVPGLFAGLMLLVGFLVIELSSPADTSQVAAASVTRTDDQTANRSFARTGELDIPTTMSTVLETTTTTEAPTTTSTTAAPVTTTTEAPTTTTTAAPAPVVAEAATSGNVESGKASYYAYKAGGCAHKTLPKGTVVTVTNLSNGKSATCVVNDRGPYIAGRIIDLDTSVFKQLASTSAGVFSARISW